MDKKIKNYLGIVATIGAGAVALSSLLYGAFYAWTSYDSLDSYYNRTFSVTAEGKTIIVPDIAKFTASVITEGGKDLSATQTKNTENANKVIDFVKSQGVEAKDIKTIGYNVTPRYQSYNCRSSICPPPDITGYTVSQNLEVKVRDTGKAGAILSGMVENGANSVSQLTFAVDNPEKAEAGARTEAVEKAKEKAKSLAKAGGFKIGKITSIYDSTPYVPYAGGDYISFEKSAMPAPAPAVEPGSQEVKISVTITYEIK